MGYLTPILIRNDSVHMFNSKNKKLQKEILDKLYMACCERSAQSISIGNHCNAIESLGTADASENRVVVISGNTWVDVWREAHNLIENKLVSQEDMDIKIGYIKSCLSLLKQEVKTTSQKLKVIKERFIFKKI